VLLYQWLLKSGDFYFGDLGILRTAVTPPMDLQNESVRIILSRPDNRQRSILRETQNRSPRVVHPGLFFP